VPWLQPIPDAAVVVASRADIRLALIAALQYLPARQRAVLILRDVLGWRAAEVAELLGTTTTAVNSALQRARERLQAVAPRAEQIREPADPGDLDLVNRYATAFENADVLALTNLLREDAIFEMPPLPAWFAGRSQIGAFLRTHVLRSPGVFTLVPTAANGQPALAVYRRGDDGVRRGYAIQVLTLRAGRVEAIVAFLDPGLFATFGLAPTLAAASTPAPALAPSVVRSRCTR
jgi:RNA polymerase sigma-70 factor (ECF subfamily)